MPKKLRPYFPLTPFNVLYWRKYGSVMPVGKYAGLSVQQIVFSLPAYTVLCSIKYQRTLPTREMSRHVNIINKRPFIGNCSCGNAASCLVFSHPMAIPSMGCDNCFPKTREDPSSTPIVLREYGEISLIVFGGGVQTKKWQSWAIRCLRESKGYAGYITFKKIGRFSP